MSSIQKIKEVIDEKIITYTNLKVFLDTYGELKWVQEAIERICDEKVLVEEWNGKYLVGIKGVPNGFGTKAEQNARVTAEYIKKMATKAGYSAPLEVNGFTKLNLPPLKNMIVLNVDAEFWDMLSVIKEIK